MPVSMPNTRWTARIHRIGTAAVVAGAVALVPLATPANGASRPLDAVGDNFMIAMEANTSVLWTADSHGNAGTDTGQGMAGDTNPAVTALNFGGTFDGTEVAWQDNAGTLRLQGSAGNVATGLGMRFETSPSITPTQVGGYEVAFQGGNGDLWTTGTVGTTDWHFGMNPLSSPSITTLASGALMIAFEANTNVLWTMTIGVPGGVDTGLAMMAGTNPAIVGQNGGGWVIAWQNPGGTLETFGQSGTNLTGLPMMVGTSPAIAAVAHDGFEIAYQTSGAALAVFGTAAAGTFGLGMRAGSSPSITGLKDGGYQVAFEANTTTLWTAGSDGNLSLALGMFTGSSPSITAIT